MCFLALAVLHAVHTQPSQSVWVYCYVSQAAVEDLQRMEAEANAEAKAKAEAEAKAKAEADAKAAEAKKAEQAKLLKAAKEKATKAWMTSQE